MFDNPGGKIKTLAKVCFWIILIGMIVGGIVLLVRGNNLNTYRRSSPSAMLTGLGLGSILLSPLLAWLSTIVLYGLGELIENSTLIRGRLDLLEHRVDRSLPGPDSAAHKPDASAAAPYTPPSSSRPRSARGRPAGFSSSASMEGPRSVSSVPDGKKDCPYCGARNSAGNTVCFACGKDI